MASDQNTSHYTDIQSHTTDRETTKNENTDRGMNATDIKSGVSHVLVEFSNMDQLTLPVKVSSRIKYTCISVSQNYIAIGTSTGALYMFGRADQRYIQAIQADTNSAQVTHLEIGPNDQLLTFATSAGLVSALEHHAGRREKVEKLRTSTIHRGCEVTCLVWNDKGTRIYIGDNRGTVSLINISRELFSFSCETMMKLDSAIVQIDAWSEQVLVSTATRCFLGNTTKQTFSHIGKKLRETPQGGCFYGGSGLELPLVYCPRPGSRIWEVDNSGKVLNTQQFKHLLDTPSTDILEIEGSVEYQLSNVSPGPQSIVFRQMYVISNQYLLSLCDQGLFVFNPSSVKLVLWNSQVTLKGIVTYCLRKNEIYVLFPGNTVRRLSLVPVYKLIQKLVEKEQYQFCAKLALSFHYSLLGKCCDNEHYESNMLMISSIIENLLQQGNVAMAKQLKVLISELKMDSNSNQVLIADQNNEIQDQNEVELKEEKTNFNRTDSGIFVSRSRTLSFESSENFSEVDHQTLLDRIKSKPVESGSVQKKPELDTISQCSESSQDENKVEGNWGLKNKAQIKIGKAQNTLVGLKNKLKGKLSRKESVNEKDYSLKIDKKKNNVDKAAIESPTIKRKLSDVDKYIVTFRKEEESDNEGIMIGKEIDLNQEETKSELNDVQNQNRTTEGQPESSATNSKSVIETDTILSHVNDMSICDLDQTESKNEGQTNQNEEDMFPTSCLIDINLTREKSCESLYSFRSSDQISSEERSRDLSLSSGEVLANTTSMGPEPSYKKTYGVKKRPGQKKRASVVSFGGEEDSSGATKVRKSKTDKKKSKRSKSRTERNTENNTEENSTTVILNHCNEVENGNNMKGNNETKLQNETPILLDNLNIADSEMNGMKGPVEVSVINQLGGNRTCEISEHLHINQTSITIEPEENVNKTETIENKSDRVVFLIDDKTENNEFTSGALSKDACFTLDSHQMRNNTQPNLVKASAKVPSDSQSVNNVTDSTEQTSSSDLREYASTPSNIDNVTTVLNDDKSTSDANQHSSAKTTQNVNISHNAKFVSKSGDKLKDTTTVFSYTEDHTATFVTSNKELIDKSDLEVQAQEIISNYLDKQPANSKTETIPNADLTTQDAGILSDFRHGEIVITESSVQEGTGSRVVHDPPLISRSFSAPTFEAQKQGLSPGRISLTKLSTVKEKLSSRAKSIVQSLKVTKDKITSSKETQQPLLDVVEPVKQKEELHHQTTSTEGAVIPESHENKENVMKTPLVELTELQDATDTALNKLLEIDKNSENMEDMQKAILQSWITCLNNATMLQLKSNLIGEENAENCNDCGKPKKDNAIISGDCNEDTQRESDNEPKLYKGENGASEVSDENKNCDSKPSVNEISGQHNLNENDKDSCQYCICNSSVSNACLSFKTSDNVLDMICIWDPFDMPEQLHKDVAYLTTLCLENACYGAIFRKENVSTEHVFDEEMHLFMQCYFHCLDTSRVHGYLVNISDHDKRKKSWNVLVKCLQAKSLNDDMFSHYIDTCDFPAALEIILSKSKDGHFDCLGHIYRLFQSDPKKTVCLENFPNTSVHPVDVLYMCYDTKSTAEWGQLLVEYVQNQVKITAGQLDCLNVLCHICQDVEVYTAVLQTFLTFDTPKEELSCSCGKMPSPLSHLVTWTHGRIILDLVRLHPELSKAKKELCSTNGFWVGYLLLLSDGNSVDRRERAALLLQLNDGRILSSQHLGKFASTEEEWLQLLRLKQKLTTRWGSGQAMPYSSHVNISHDSYHEDVTVSSQINNVQSDEHNVQDVSERSSSIDEDECPVFILNNSCEELQQNFQNILDESVNKEPIGSSSVRTTLDTEISTSEKERLQKSSSSDMQTLFCLNCREQLKSCDISGSNQFSSHEDHSIAFNENHSQLSDSSSAQSDYFLFPSIKLAENTVKSNKTSDWTNRFEQSNQKPLYSPDSTRNKDSDWLSVFNSSNPAEYKEKSDSELHQGLIPTEISWAMLAHMCVEIVGTRKAFVMLSSVDMPLSALPFQFHQDCVTQEVLYNQQRKLHQTTLDKLDKHFLEKGENLSEVKVINIAKSKYQVDQCSAESSVSQIPIEDIPTMDLSSSCVVCGLELTRPVVETDDRVVLFQCGHGFHKACISSLECLVCSNEQEP